MEILQIFVYIFGHDNVIDGAIGNADNFHLVGGGDGSFSEFTEPFGSSDGLNFWDIFNFYAFTFRLRSESLRDMDACLDAFDYFMLVNG